jgi:hypothetical protein
MTSESTSAKSMFRPTWLFENLETKALFYVGVPAFTALIFGLNHTGMARHLSVGVGVPYWLGIAFPLWLTLDLSSRLTALALRPWRPRGVIVLLVGALLGVVAFSPYLEAYANWFQRFLPPGASYSVTTPKLSTLSDLGRLLAYSGAPLYWIIITSAFARFLAFPGYVRRPEHQQSGPVEAAPAPQAEVERTGVRALVPNKLGQQILALQAEDHYVRVFTDRGDTLVRYRFSEAVREMRFQPGVQIHRSYWVALAAVQQVRPDGKGFRVQLQNGLEAPVSRSNLGVLRAAGLI